jgi:hypothetical protein
MPVIRVHNYISSHNFLPMKSSLSIIFFLFIVHFAMAQENNIAGTYYLTGVMETGSGFKLDKDSSFEFFYSYGALDRYGSGRWSVQDHKIILNSKPYPGSDFKLVKNEVTKNNFTTIQIDNSNKMFYRFVSCLQKTKDGDSLINANSNGIIVLPGTIPDTIHLLFELTPERISSFAIDNKETNSFTFQFQPWIVEVFFKDFMLEFKEDHLEGPHPLLEKPSFTYTRE